MQPILNATVPTTLPPAPNKRLIGEWTIREKVVCLFLEKKRFECSTEGRTGPISYSFRTDSYDSDYAINLVSMFHDVIGMNLTEEELHSSCFLPQFCKPAQNEPTLLTALFGRVDTRTAVSGELIGMRWGVFDSSSSQELPPLEVSADDAIARIFLRNAPSANRCEVKGVVNSTIINRNSIDSIFLHYVSLLDKNTILSETDWAVTMVSAKHSSRSSFSTPFSNVGHAMLACEGVEENKPFLRYLHLTKEPAKKLAQMECFERQPPLDTVNGPTWQRSKALVENMFRFVQSNEQHSFKFAAYGYFFSGPSYPLSLIRDELLGEGVQGTRILQLTAEVSINYPWEKVPINCLQAVYEIARSGGIIFYGNKHALTTPMEKMRILQTAPVFQIPEGFHAQLNGAALSQTSQPQQALSDQMLSSHVYLTPNDCPPDECWKWANQSTIEETIATDREIERFNEMSDFGTWSQYFQYKAWWPKRW
jgi:hypothetical protein